MVENYFQKHNLNFREKVFSLDFFTNFYDFIVRNN